MNEIRYTLVSEGSSDRALLPILTWLLHQHTTGYAIQPEWANLGRVPRPPPKRSPKEIEMALDLYPCDILFIHKDKDNNSYELRVAEIQNTLSQVEQWSLQRSVGVIPIRETEAWLLIDEAALRRAAGNPNGNQDLQIPPLNQLENLTNPKQLLHQLLKDASGLTVRRLKNFSVGQHMSRITDFITDFSPLRALEAFQKLEHDVSRVVHEQGWAGN